MNKFFIRQIFFAVALAVVAPVFNSVQAQTNNYGGFTDNDLVLWKTVTSYDWNDLRYFVTAVNGTLATDISVGGLSGRDCYIQDLAIPTNNGGNIADTNYSLELRSRTTTSFDGANLFVGVNKIGEKSSMPITKLILAHTLLAIELCASLSAFPHQVIHLLNRLRFMIHLKR